VNTGKAKAADVLELMELIKEKVLEVSGVRLEPEIKIIGEDA
jgi:UDP-N-acetylmuramate dehydrogenase